MMTAQDQERYDTLVDTIDECLRILREDFGSSYIFASMTDIDDKDNVTIHTNCNYAFSDALVIFDDLAEKDSNIAKIMSMVAKHTERNNK